MTYVGAGGNIGSQAVAVIARLPDLARITLVDPDVYEERNMRSQAIESRDVGRCKVDVLASRVRRINPALQVEAIAAPVEDVPLGALRADVIATGLDGLAPRRTVNRAAWRLGVPWVDAGVRAEGSLARVDVFAPAPDAACLECAWGEAEHAVLDRSYPCDGRPALAPTGAPAHLGALAGALQCDQVAKLLAGDTRRALVGRQALLETDAHRHYVSARPPSSECPFDHRRWAIRALPGRAGSVTLAAALRLLPGSAPDEARLRVHGDAFVHRLVCPQCGASRAVLRLARRLTPRQRGCERCGGAMLAAGLDTSDTLALADVAARQGRASLFALGLRARDVFSVEGPSGEAHFEIGD